MFRGKVKGSNDYVVIKDMEIQNQNSVHEWQKEIDIMAYVLPNCVLWSNAGESNKESLHC